jgi:hypothetical protein
MRSALEVPDPGNGFASGRQVMPISLVMSALAVQTTPGYWSH